MSIKNIYTLLLAAITATAAGAQNKPGKFDACQYQAELEQFIVTEAALSPEEAEAFFPLYREYTAKRHAIFKDKRMQDRFRPATDEQCREAIEYSDQREIEMKELQEQYHRKYMNALPAGKVYDIIKAEEKFHRQSFKDASARDDRHGCD